MKQKIIKFFLIGSMIGCLLAENLYAQDEDNKKPSNDNQNFYRVIVENNLFRALGWRKPKRESDYVLIGTLIEQNGKVAKAFVMEQRSSRYYSVSVGEKIGKSTVEKIEANQISLNTAGKTVTLKTDSVQFLSSSGGKGGGPKESPQGASSSQNKENKEQAQNRNNRGGNRQDSSNLRDRFRNASPEERRRLIQEFRQRGGGGGGGRRGGGGDGRRGRRR